MSLKFIKNNHFQYIAKEENAVMFLSIVCVCVCVCSRETRGQSQCHSLGTCHLIFVETKSLSGLGITIDWMDN